MKLPFHSSRSRSPITNLWNMPTEEQAIKAYRMFVAGNLNPLVIPDLCKHWEISQRTLMNILHRKSWKDFPLESFLPPRADVQTPVQSENNP